MTPYAEFVEQIAYHRQFPWGDDWAQAGVNAWAAMQGPHVKFQQRKPADFIPQAPKPPQSPEYIWDFFKGFAEARRVIQGRNGKH